jgi:16S rRNA (guanine966-N2)-methyltransferase
LIVEIVLGCDLDVEALTAVGTAIGDDVVGLEPAVRRFVRQQMGHTEAVDTRDRRSDAHRGERTAPATVRTMRVVAGSARGLRLSAPTGHDVRPTSDRVREAMFNALGSLGALEDVRVLDLFAGSGALAIEALSRGAASAVLVDHDRLALEAIRRNLHSTGLEEQAEVVGSDAHAYLRGTGHLPGTRSDFGLVLLDPPYRFAAWDGLFEELRAVLTPETVVVIESDREVTMPVSWSVERQKRYGSTFVGIVRPPETPSPNQPEPR